MVVVVAVELLTAMSLVLRPRIGGIAAAALLSAFTVVLVRGMRMGAPVSCGCFGSASKEPVGPMTIVRNAFLLVLAASTLAAVRPAHSLAAVLTVGAAAMVGLVVLTLVGLRSTVGPLLAGPIVVPSSLSASVGVA